MDTSSDRIYRHSCVLDVTCRYKVGCDLPGKYRVALDSDAWDFGGQGRVRKFYLFICFFFPPSVKSFKKSGHIWAHLTLIGIAITKIRLPRVENH